MAKLNKLEYIKILHALATTTLSAEDISDYFDLSPRSIRDIQSGVKHKWLQEEYSKQFKIMQEWRKDLKTFRDNSLNPPQIDLDIDLSFVDNLTSARRSYSFDKRPENERNKAPRKWISLIHTDGTEADFSSAEEAEEAGLKASYLTQLKAGKLLRYKGYRLK